MREVKFDYIFEDLIDNEIKHIQYSMDEIENNCLKGLVGNKYVKWIARRQYTELKDKNGMGLTEVYEGDIIDENGIIKGNIYEMDKRETDIVIPQLGTKAWNSAYKEAVVRGFDYSE